METKYEVRKLTVGIDGTTTETTVFAHDDLDQIMRYWNSYASGINDANDPYFPDSFDAQNFSDAIYHRIVAR